MKRMIVPAVTSLMICVTVAAQPRKQAPVTIVDLGVLPGAEYSEARSINDIGQVVGRSGIESGFTLAFLWEDGVMVDLGTLGGGFSDAWDVNDLGQVVGQARTASGEFHAFLWQDGAMIDLDPRGVAASRAIAINNAGEILGHIGSQPVIWRDGDVVELELQFATAIDDRGEVAGYVLDESGQARSVIWSHGRIIELNPFEGVEAAQPSAINRRGQVAGTATLAGGFVRAFVSRGRRLLDLGGLYEGGFSFGLDINRFGEVVGEASAAPTTFARHGVLWTHQGTAIDLGTLPDEGVTCNFPPCLSSSARAISDTGQVAGISENADGQWRAVVWTR